MAGGLPVPNIDTVLRQGGGARFLGEKSPLSCVGISVPPCLSFVSFVFLFGYVSLFS